MTDYRCVRATAKVILILHWYLRANQYIMMHLYTLNRCDEVQRCYKTITETTLAPGGMKALREVPVDLKQVIQVKKKVKILTCSKNYNR